MSPRFDVSAAWTVVRGFAMGAADVVPGVSGGTIALVLGIYERLVANIRRAAEVTSRLLRADGRGAVTAFRSIEWGFLVPLGLGLGVAVVSLARVIDTLLEEEPVAMSGLFFGLVAASAVVAWGLIGVRDRFRLTVLVSVGVVTFVALGFQSGERADPALWAFLAGGALAVCAMILPGVSGSFLLLTVGMYQPVLDAVNDRQFDQILMLAVGALVGLIAFSTVLHWALETHHDTVMAALVGLMVGSLRVLWPWPAGIEEVGLGRPDGDVGLAVGLAIVAAAGVLAFTRYANRADPQPAPAVPPPAVP